MKKLILIILVVLLTSCIGESQIQDYVIVNSVQEHHGVDSKYLIEFKNSAGRTKLYTNTLYQVGDTLRICK